MIEVVTMSKYQRPTGSIDVKIEEIPDGTFRVKIIGTVVNKNPTSITINDGTGTVTLSVSGLSIENLEIKTLGRFICEITRADKKVGGNLITWNPISRETVEKYWKLVGIERRIPK